MQLSLLGQGRRTAARLESGPRPTARAYTVEQIPAGKDGFPRSVIDAPEHLVRIPRLKHWEITGWFATRNKAYDMMSPREYLRGKGWNERMNVGRDALIKHGVLKP